MLLQGVVVAYIGLYTFGTGRVSVADLSHFRAMDASVSAHACSGRDGYC